MAKTRETEIIKPLEKLERPNTLEDYVINKVFNVLLEQLKLEQLKDDQYKIIREEFEKERDYFVTNMPGGELGRTIDFIRTKVLTTFDTKCYLIEKDKDLIEPNKQVSYPKHIKAFVKTALNKLVPYNTDKETIKNKGTNNFEQEENQNNTKNSDQTEPPQEEASSNSHVTKPRINSKKKEKNNNENESPRNDRSGSPSNQPQEEASSDSPKSKSRKNSKSKEKDNNENQLADDGFFSSTLLKLKNPSKKEKDKDKDKTENRSPRDDRYESPFLQRLRKSSSTKAKKEITPEEMHKELLEIYKLINSDKFISGVKLFDTFMSNVYAYNYKKAKHLKYLIQLINRKVIVSFAETFTALAYKASINVVPQDAETITEGARVSDLLSNYVKDDILLSSRNAGDDGDVIANNRDLAIERWIAIAEYTHDQGDYISTFAIMNAVCNSVQVTKIYNREDLSEDAQEILFPLNNAHYKSPDHILHSADEAKANGKKILEPLYRLTKKINNFNVAIGFVSGRIKTILETKNKVEDELKKPKLSKSEKEKLNEKIRETLDKVGEETTDEMTFNENLETLKKSLEEEQKKKEGYQEELQKMTWKVNYVPPEITPFIQQSIEQSINKSNYVQIFEFNQQVEGLNKWKTEVNEKMKDFFSETYKEEVFIKLKDITAKLNTSATEGEEQNKLLKELTTIQEDINEMSDDYSRNKFTRAVNKLKNIASYNLLIIKLNELINERETHLDNNAKLFKEKGTVESQITKMFDGELTFSENKLEDIKIQSYHSFYEKAYRDFEEMLGDRIGLILQNVSMLNMQYYSGTKDMKKFEIKNKLKNKLKSVKDIEDEEKLHMDFITTCDEIVKIIKDLIAMIKEDTHFKTIDLDDMNDFLEEITGFRAGIEEDRNIYASIWNDRALIKKSTDNSHTITTTTMTTTTTTTTTATTASIAATTNTDNVNEAAKIISVDTTKVSPKKQRFSLSPRKYIVSKPSSSENSEVRPRASSQPAQLIPSSLWQQPIAKTPEASKEQEKEKKTLS